MNLKQRLKILSKLVNITPEDNEERLKSIDDFHKFYIKNVGNIIRFNDAPGGETYVKEYKNNKNYILVHKDGPNYEIEKVDNGKVTILKLSEKDLVEIKKLKY